jgi:hypothetical protein
VSEKAPRVSGAPATPAPRAAGAGFTWDGFVASLPAFAFLLSADGRYAYASRRPGGGDVDATGRLLERC